MKKVGLIGGISWVSTLDYYKAINLGINSKLGGLNFSECLIYSFNYQDIKKNNDANDWERTYQMIAAASKNLINAGAEAIALCANTMHMIADRLEEESGIPLIHIATETTAEVLRRGVKKVALLGTKFTMEQDFFRSKLNEKGVEILTPSDEDKDFIHYTIFEELGRGVINESTQKRYLAIIDQLIALGAEGVILGCTEIPLIVFQQDVKMPIFDTTAIHSAAIVQFQLSTT